MKSPAVAVAIITCAVASAQSTAGASGASPAYLLAQALVSLAVVIGIIYLAWFGLRRLSQKQLGLSEDGPLRVIQARHLGGDRWLYLVRVGNRTLLVGGGADGVRPVADLGEDWEDAGDET